MSDPIVDVDPQEAFDFVWKKRKWIGEKLSELQGWWRREQQPEHTGADEVRCPVLIIGAGGTGKSTLLRFLTNNLDPLVDPVDQYIESLNVETGYDRNSGLEFAVLPGQPDREAQWEESFRRLSQGEFRGVIFVSSAGYNAFGEGISIKRHPLFTGDLDSFLNAYVDKCRSEELRILSKLETALTANPSRIWLLTICTKQDLWWPADDAVETYYRNGKFADRLAEVTKGCAATRFRSEICFCSLVISNWFTKKAELVAPNAAGYDQHYQLKAISDLVSKLVALKSWEQETR